MCDRVHFPCCFCCPGWQMDITKFAKAPLYLLQKGNVINQLHPPSPQGPSHPLWSRSAARLFIGLDSLFLFLNSFFFFFFLLFDDGGCMRCQLTFYYDDLPQPITTTIYCNRRGGGGCTPRDESRRVVSKTAPKNISWNRMINKIPLWQFFREQKFLLSTNQKNPQFLIHCKI